MVPPVPPESDWFPIRVTSSFLDSGGKTAYTFQEVWLDGSAAIADKIGGRVNASGDPAYAIDGSTFSPTAAGSNVQVLARRGSGAGGQKWELKGSGGVTAQTAFNPTNLAQSGLVPLWTSSKVAIGDLAFVLAVHAANLLSTDQLFSFGVAIYDRSNDVGNEPPNPLPSDAILFLHVSQLGEESRFNLPGAVGAVLKPQLITWSGTINPASLGGSLPNNPGLVPAYVPPGGSSLQLNLAAWWVIPLSGLSEIAG